ARDVARPGDAEPATVRQPAVALLPPARALDRVQALEEAVRRDAQLVDRARAAAQEVSPPQLDRVHADRFRELVELDLEREARLHRPVAALGAARRLVRVHARRIEAVRLERV